MIGFVNRNGWRTLAAIGVIAGLVAIAAPRVFAAGEGVAESLGLRDSDDHVRARLGAQGDGSFGLRIWNSDGTLAYDLTPGAGSVGAPRTGTSIADLGTGMKDGESGYLHLGAGSLESVPVTWDATREKWVTASAPLSEVVDDVSAASTTYANVLTADAIRRPIVGLKELYDAGLRPEVSVQAFMRAATSTGSVLVRAGLNELPDGSDQSSLVATGGEVSVTGTTNRMRFSNWTAMDVSTPPTQEYGLGYLQLRATAGGQIAGGSVSAEIRWVG